MGAQNASSKIVCSNILLLREVPRTWDPSRLASLSACSQANTCDEEALKV